METTKYLSAILVCGILFLMISCQDKQAKEELTKFKEVKVTEAKNIDIAKKFYRFLDEQKLDSCIALFAVNNKGYIGSSNESFQFADIIPYIKSYYTAFPDYKHEIENIFASGDYVVSQLKYSGNQASAFMEIPSTGKKIDYKGIFIFKIQSGKIVESWGIEDDLTMMKQLGLELK
jgi:predicted ester cyclase